MKMSQNSTLPLYLRFLLLFVIVLFSNCAFAQNNITIIGKVTDKDANTPLARVSVTVRGSKTGVVTNDEGNYTITLPAGSTLIFTFLESTPEQVKVTQSRTLNISLSTKPQNMDEVVVIGYGTRKKKDVTGAISTVG